jgi:hypothetical protein
MVLDEGTPLSLVHHRLLESAFGLPDPADDTSLSTLQSVNSLHGSSGIAFALRSCRPNLD